MKILVFAHWLEVGGTQVNAIELSALLRDAHGHEVTYFATPGPMLTLVEEKRLRFRPAPPASIHPSPARMRALVDLMRRERPDVLHVWDWWQCLDAYYVAPLMMRVPMVVTDMSMSLCRMLPKAVPTTFGTPELVDQARATGRQRLELILPPVDVDRNAPGAVDPRPFRERHGIEDRDVLLVTVSRLSNWMKSEGLRRTVDAVRTLGRELPLRLVIVGDGEARPELERLAREANSELGKEAVVLAGALLDPRPAYAAADILVGMGGSALRGMAFGKPVLIVGERGFSAPFTPETAASFYYRGMYGVGEDEPGNSRLVEDLRSLAEHPGRLPALGEFSREFVVEHFALDKVGARLESFLRTAANELPPLHVAAADGLRTAAVWMRERRFLPPHWNAKMKELLSMGGKSGFP
jgi:glycosyltransferase involved in cell wall biosynthesis